jgi:hypothetical protein
MTIVDKLCLGLLVYCVQIYTEGGYNACGNVGGRSALRRSALQLANRRLAGSDMAQAKLLELVVYLHTHMPRGRNQRPSLLLMDSLGPQLHVQHNTALERGRVGKQDRGERDPEECEHECAMCVKSARAGRSRGAGTWMRSSL